MNVFWKVTQNILSKRLFLRYHVVKRRSILSRIKPKNVFPQNLLTKHYFKICIGSTIIPQGKLNVEDDLRRAVEEGQASIINLMDELRDLVTSASNEYRACLTQEIEFIKKTGDSASEELPKFRTLANELVQELNEYVILLKTIGEIAYDHALVSFRVDKAGLELILRKYKELEILLLHEFELNKRKELELLEISIANIAVDD